MSWSRPLFPAPGQAAAGRGWREKEVASRSVRILGLGPGKGRGSASAHEFCPHLDACAELADRHLGGAGAVEGTRPSLASPTEPSPWESKSTLGPEDPQREATCWTPPASSSGTNRTRVSSNLRSHQVLGVGDLPRSRTTGPGWLFIGLSSGPGLPGGSAPSRCSGPEDLVTLGLPFPHAPGAPVGVWPLHT